MSKEVAIYSPLGNGCMFIGKWDKPYSPKEMIQANPQSHGFHILNDRELEEYDMRYHFLMPAYPGEWSVLGGE
jgi:hypothetical protein